MFEGFKLTKEFIRFEDNVASWEDAIIKSSEPLLSKGYVEQSYIDAMLDSVNEYGPYIVITPNVALPHARPETGSKIMGFSILKLKEPVAFSEEVEHQVSLLIALSCVDSTTHMEMLQGIVMVLSDEEKYAAICNATTKEEILEVFK